MVYFDEHQNRKKKKRLVSISAQLQCQDSQSYSRCLKIPDLIFFEHPVLYLDLCLTSREAEENSNLK